jgi:hypothetical protein
MEKEFSAEAAFFSVASISFCPPTVFFSAAYPESLFLLLCLTCFSFLRTGRLSYAALAAGLASGTRPFGLILALPVVLHSFLSSRKSFLRTCLHSVTSGLVSLLGLICYMLYLTIRFNDPFLFASASNLWNRFEPSSYESYLPWELARATLASRSTEFILGGAFFVIFILISSYGARYLPARYTAFSLAAFGILYWRAPALLFQSYPRYVFEMVPIHMTIGIILARYYRYSVALIAFVAALSTFWTALYIRGYFVR